MQQDVQVHYISVTVKFSKKTYLYDLGVKFPSIRHLPVYIRTFAMTSSQMLNRYDLPILVSLINTLTLNLKTKVDKEMLL